MPQRKFAKVLGVSHSSLASWIRGESFPSHDSLLKIAGIAKISIDELLNRLKGEAEVRRIQRAEDLLPQVNVLPRKERICLLKLSLWCRNCANIALIYYLPTNFSVNLGKVYGKSRSCVDF